MLSIPNYYIILTFCNFRYKYDAIFDTLNPIDGKVSGSAAKGEMIKSKLPNNVLGKIWKLSDVDKDGKK